MSGDRGPARGGRRRSGFAAKLVNSAAANEPPTVIDDLRRAVVTGDSPPGTLIPIEAVARFFGVSAIPVREALKLLTGEGLVDHVPHVGYSVAKLTFAEFRELYDVRQALEEAAVRNAVSNASPADDLEVSQANEQMSAALRVQDQRAYNIASRRFHFALLVPARMPRLQHMYESAWNMTEPTQPMSHVHDSSLSHIHADHGDILAGFIARDVLRVIDGVRHHYRNLRAAMEDFADDPELFRRS